MISMRAASKAAWVVGVGGILLPMLTHAELEPFFLDPSPPDFIEVLKRIYGVDPRTGEEVKPNIPDHIEKAQCGGWNRDLEIGVDLGPPGYISKVQGLPGREGKPLGAIFTGMSKRDEQGGLLGDGYQFPNSAAGLSTTCDIGAPGKVNKSVWDEQQKGYVVKEFHNPRFQDPPCLWYSMTDPVSTPSPPDLTFREYDPPHTEARCDQFCGWLNKFTYDDCRVFQQDVDNEQDCNLLFKPNGDPQVHCAQWSRRYTCSDAWVDGTPNPKVIPPNCKQAGVRPPGPNLPTSQNCEVCVGGECRCKLPPEANLRCEKIANRGEGNGKDFASYFRKYMTIRYQRSAVEDVPTDIATNTAKTKCYGFYEEFDPKDRQTVAKDRRCMIEIDVKRYPETQMGKGQIVPDEEWPDPDPLDDENQREDGEYDENEDLWYQKLGRAFSFLNLKLFGDRYESDLTNVYLDADDLDRGDHKATPQLDEDEEHILAESNQLRAFDDTGENRSIVRWWQKQQTEAASLFHRPIIRMLLPSDWALGIDVNDPLFAGAVSMRAVEPPESRTRSIEIQIRAEEDILGAVLGYLERSMLLPVEEEQVPLVVPLGSPTEFRAVAQDWCKWHIRESGESNCAEAPEEVRELIDKLESYADDVENVRKLRSALALHAGAALKLQADISRPVSEWVGKSIGALGTLVEEQILIAEELLPMWRDIQGQMLTFELDTNMPWCMNQRYTTPIYSLLDEWLKSREIEGSLFARVLPPGAEEEIGLPELANFEMRPRDITIDLSTVAYMTGSLKLPVLRPIQVRLTLPRPPGPNEEHGLTGDELPDFPDIDEIMAAVQANIDGLPEVEVADTPPPPPTPEPLGIPTLIEISEEMLAIAGTIGEMDKTYDDFWKSLRAFENPEAAPFCKQKGDLKPLECCGWDAFPCVHVETDLLERMTRIGSRPLVMLDDDYRSVGEAKEEGSVCLPQDHSCDILNPQLKLESVRWEAGGDVTNEKNVDALRDEMRRLTLPKNIGEIDPEEDLLPYDVNVNSLLPAFDIPPLIDLFPSDDDE
jgi:hypothetical protein